MNNKNYLGIKRSYWILLLLCFIIAFFISGNCSQDEFSEPDPLFGGGGLICTENISWLQILTKTLGLFVFGVIAYNILKSKEND